MADITGDVSPPVSTEEEEERDQVSEEREEIEEPPVEVPRDQEEEEGEDEEDQSFVTNSLSLEPSLENDQDHEQNDTNGLPIETQLNINNESPIEESPPIEHSPETTPSETSQITEEPITPISEEIVTKTEEDDKVQATPTMPPTSSNKENARVSSGQKKPLPKKMTPIRSQSSPSVGVRKPSPKGTPGDYSGRRKSSGKKSFQPTVPKPFNFCLEQRLEERGDYEKKMKSMRDAAEEKEKRDKERRQKEEEEEIKSIRKSLIHKARPIQYYNPITVVPSEKPLTVPEPPNLQLTNRNRTVRDKDSSVPLKQVL